MADEVQAQVHAIAHALENRAERLDRAFRNLCDTRLEVDRRHEPRQLDRLETVGESLAELDRVAELGVDAVRILHPLHERCVERQVALHSLAHRCLVDLVRRDGKRQRDTRKEQDVAKCVHRAPPCGCFTGPPRRQNTSGSTMSS